MKKKDKYEIVSMTKGETSKGANYFDLEVSNTLTGDIIKCVYFGNTTPRRVVDIIGRKTENAIYQMAIIQPHTSRDKKTGRFTSYKRVGAHI